MAKMLTKKEQDEIINQLSNICNEQKETIKSYAIASKCMNCGEKYYRDYGIELKVELDIYKDRFKRLLDFCNINILHKLKTVTTDEKTFNDYMAEIAEKKRIEEIEHSEAYCFTDLIKNGCWGYRIIDNNIQLEYRGPKNNKEGYVLSFDFSKHKEQEQ